MFLEKSMGNVGYGAPGVGISVDCSTAAAVLPYLVTDRSHTHTFTGRAGASAVLIRWVLPWLADYRLRDCRSTLHSLFKYSRCTVKPTPHPSSVTCRSARAAFLRSVVPLSSLRMWLKPE
jgi:hypothetical protein